MIANIKTKLPTLGLQLLLSKYTEIFTDELGNIQSFTAILQVRITQVLQGQVCVILY